jgi:hypothetical protein
MDREKGEREKERERCNREEGKDSKVYKVRKREEALTVEYERELSKCN